MNYLLFVLGFVLLFTAVVDLLWTTLWVDGGGGPLTARMMAGVWHGLRTVANGRSRLLSTVGPLLVILTFGMWIGLLLAGWTCIFASGENALIDTQQGGVSGTDLVYFATYSAFTLGIGDIIPREGAWQIATVLATASGMLLITMSVSYVISVLGIVSRKRAFASSVTAVGSRSEEFVRKGWNGDDFDGFELMLDSLAEEVDYLTYQYNAYPILHYYHTQKDEHASSVGIAIFGEALILLRCAVPEDARPNSALIENAASSAKNYLETRSSAYIPPADHPPPSPDLDVLRDAGIPTVSDEEFAAALEEFAEERRQLRGMVEADARRWPSDAD